MGSGGENVHVAFAYGHRLFQKLHSTPMLGVPGWVGWGCGVTPMIEVQLRVNTGTVHGIVQKRLGILFMKTGYLKKGFL